MPRAIYIECHDEEIMRGREEARESSSPLFFSFPLPPHGNGGCAGRGAFLKAPSYPWHTNNGCGIKGPPGSRIRLSYTQCRHIWFTSLLAFLDSFPRRRGYKAQDGLHFCLFWNFTKESFTLRKRPRRLRARSSFSLSHPFPCFAASLFPLFPSYFPRLAAERCARMNKGQRYVQDIPPLSCQILTFLW